MKRLILQSVLVAFVISPLWATPRLLWHTAPSRWTEALPESQHPAFPSDIGTIQEGRLSLGFGINEKDLDHLTLSLPGFQILSANTPIPTLDDSTGLEWAPEILSQFFDSLGNPQKRYRGFFALTGGVALSTFRSNPSIWDIGIGATYESVALFDESEKKELWSDRRVLGGLTLRYNHLSLAGSWSTEEFRYRFGYRIPEDWQAGIAIYQNPNLDQAVGTIINGEKSFHRSLRVYGKLENQWVAQRRVKQLMSVGAFMRFRPWRAGVDPVWLERFISPFSKSKYERYVYDWEIGLEVAIDQSTSHGKSVLTLSRWF